MNNTITNTDKNGNHFAKVSELKPHPQNNYFFDDMTGDKWKEFLTSIKSRGVIEPIIATTDMIVVSGHQRLRACKELGIDTVKVEIRHYNNDDEILQELLETNIRQRGTISGSTVKMGRCITELERLYGIGHGGDRKSEKIKTAIGGSENCSPHTQKELARQFGVSPDVLQRAKTLASLPSEIQDLVSDGKISASTASRLIAKLSPEEQEQLAATLPATEKLTQKQVQEHIESIRRVTDEQLKKLRSERDQYSELYHAECAKTNAMQEQFNQAQEPQYIEVVPEDYESIKKQLSDSQKNCEYLSNEYQAASKALQESETEINQLKADMENADIMYKRIHESSLVFCAGVANFLEQYGEYVWLADELDSMNETDKRDYLTEINNLGAWVQSLSKDVVISKTPETHPLTSAQRAKQDLEQIQEFHKSMKQKKYLTDKLTGEDRNAFFEAVRNIVQWGNDMLKNDPANILNIGFQI